MIKFSEWYSITDIPSQRAEYLNNWFNDMRPDKTITLTPEQYSVVDETVLIPEKISEAVNEN